MLANDGAATGCVEATEAEAAVASKPLDEKSDNRGYGNVSAGVGDEGGVGMDTAAGALSNEEAARTLASSNSGVKPDLSRHGYRSAKRAFDLVASGAAIALLLVPGAILVAVICIKSPGASPLYSQLRVGRLRKDGSYRLSRMCKFRSMVPDADRLLDGLKDRNEADGPLFKIKDDPRVIPGVGQFIRKHSIDELPQLINIFKGDIPSRILKTRRGSSLKKPGTFALPAKLARTQIAASLQVRSAICHFAGVLQNLFEYFIVGYGKMRKVFAKLDSRFDFPHLDRSLPVLRNGIAI